MSESKSTRDHDAIRRWAEQHGCRPVRVKDTEVIQLDCPGGAGDETFDEISWDDWLQVFDDRGLQFLYQEDTNFNKLVSAD